MHRVGAMNAVRAGALESQGRVFKTDQGNLILDCSWGPIAKPAELAARPEAKARIIEHGLFLGLATDLVVAGPEGTRHWQR